MGNGSVKPEETGTATASKGKSSDKTVPDKSDKQTKQQKDEPKEKGEDIRDKYDIGDVLGSGSFGQVREAALKDDPRKVRAVKIIEREEQEEGEWSNSAMFRREVKLLQNLQHLNIVRFWDVYEDLHFLYVVMDICRGGEVFKKILELKRFTEANAATIGAQMLAAIDYIHQKSIMHRDIKAENFLLADESPTSVVRMIDFGMATTFTHGQVFNEICGSPHYLAPELIGQKYSHMVDVWAFGVLMYLIMYGHYPFDSKNTRDIMVKVLTDPIKWQTKAKLGTQTLSFLKKVLEHNPKRRITAEAALKHPWIVEAAAPDKFEQDAPEVDDLNDAFENLTECVRSAHKKVTTTRKQVDASVEQQRNDKLKMIEDDFKKGIRYGNRLGETPKEDFMSRPEFVRRDNKLTTAPSKQIRASLASLGVVAAGAAKAAETVVRGNRKASVTKAMKVVFAEDEENGANQNKSSAASSSGAVSSSAATKDSTPEQESPDVVPKRRTKQAQTTRLKYIGDIDANEEKDLRVLWEDWRKQDREKHGGAETMDLKEEIGKIKASDLKQEVEDLERKKRHDDTVGTGVSQKEVDTSKAKTKDDPKLKDLGKAKEEIKAGAKKTTKAEEAKNKAKDKKKSNTTEFAAVLPEGKAAILPLPGEMDQARAGG